MRQCGYVGMLSDMYGPWPAKVAELLRQHDDVIAMGREPHRVTCFFCGRHDQLRVDQEWHAAGQGMSARLCDEFKLVSLPKIDDTWADTAHRDVSYISR